MRVPFAMVLAVLLAGCLSPDPPSSDDTDEEGAPTTSTAPATGTSTPSAAPQRDEEWTSWDGPYVIQLRAFAGRFPSQREPFEVTAVDAAGRLLLVDYLPQWCGDDEERYRNGTAAWASVVDEVFLAFSEGEQDGCGVFRVRATLLGSEDWGPASAALAEGLRTARDPVRESQQDVTGTSWVLVSGQRRAVLDSETDGGGGWSDVSATMQGLRMAHPEA